MAPESDRSSQPIPIEFDGGSARCDEHADVPIVLGGNGEQDPTRWLIGAIARVHSCLAHDDVQAASSLTMTILDAGELFRDPAARSILDFSRGLFESVLRARLEPLDRVILVDRVRLGSRASESPAAAFLLARLDGWVTVEDVLDFAGPLRLASLRLLVELEQQSIVCLPRTSTLRTPAGERNRRAG